MKLETFFEKFNQFADAPDSVAKMRELILTLAVQGKLVQRIKSEGIGSEILKDAVVSDEPSDDLPELPTHWVWARLGSIATRMDSGWSPACFREPAAKGEWGVLKTTAVQTLQYQEEQNKALPPNLEPRPEHEVMDGDILFTRAGPMNRVGILCVARPTRNKLMISDKIIRFHLITGIDPDFAALSMNAGHSSSVVEGLKSGMAASQVNISQPKLRSVPIPLPPLAEQKRIVAKVDALMALCDRLEAQQQEREEQASKLARASLARFADAPTPANLPFLFHPSYAIPPPTSANPSSPSPSKANSSPKTPTTNRRLFCWIKSRPTKQPWQRRASFVAQQPSSPWPMTRPSSRFPRIGAGCASAKSWSIEMANVFP